MSDDWPDDRRIRETRREAAQRIMAGLAGSTGAGNARVATVAESATVPRYLNPTDEGWPPTVRIEMVIKPHLQPEIGWQGIIPTHRKDMLERFDVIVAELRQKLAAAFGMPLPKGVSVGDDPEADPL